MIQFYSPPPKLAKRLAFLFLLLVGISQMSRAQAPTISYPAGAQDLTHGYGESLLTIKLVFNEVCNGAVRLGLPSSVTYVPGTVTKTGGTASVSIAESVITDLSKPTFSISGVAAIGDEITFTVTRRSACGSLAGGKDTVYYDAGAGGCSTTSEAVGTVNPYSIFAPALSITNATAISDALVGDKYARTFKVTNGGNGCMDTLWLCIIRDSLHNSSEGLYLNGTATLIPSYRSNGDSSFYKIYGANLPSGDALMCSGEEITFRDSLLLLNCKSTTSRFIGSWGDNTATLCQYAVSSGVINTPSVALTSSGVITTITPMEPCSPGTYRIRFTNTTGAAAGKGAGLYNIRARLGSMYGGDNNLYKTNWGWWGNFRIGTTGLTATSGTMTGTPVDRRPYSINMGQLLSDPDGAGTGLEDLDGDGQYDDLAPGKFFDLLVDRTFLPSPYTVTSTCNTPIDGGSPVGFLDYQNMCKSYTDTFKAGTNYIGSTQTYGGSSASRVPLSISGGVPFTVNFCQGKEGMIPASALPGSTTVVDSLVLEITLPAGLSYVAGSAKWAGSSTGVDVTSFGSVLQIRRKGTANNCFEAEFVYTCGTAGAKSIPWVIYQVLDRSCNAIHYRGCGTINTTAYCSVPGPCADGGASNNTPSIRRVNYGWASTARTSTADTATLPSFSKISATHYDTLSLSQSAILGTTGLSNLYYNFELAKTAGSGNALQFVSGTLYHKSLSTSAISSCSVPAPSLAASTATIERFRFDFSSLMGGACGLPSVLSTGDSVWVSLRFVVTTANNGQLFGYDFTAVPNTMCYFYNLSPSSVPAYCGGMPVNLFLVGLTQRTTNLGAVTYNNCGEYTGSNSATARLHTGTPLSVDPFPYEYRPTTYIDSIAFVLPAGYEWSIPPLYKFRLMTDTFTSPNAYTQFTPPANIITPIYNGLRAAVINDGTMLFPDFGTDHPINWAIMSPPGSKPTCSAPDTGIWKVYFYGKNYYYNGLNIPYVDSASANLYFLNRPSLSIQDLTGTVLGTKVQHYWDIRVNNTGTIAAPYLWLSVEQGAGSGGISIDSVVLKPSNVVLPVASVYNGSDQWYRVSVAGLASGANQNVRIYYKYSSCSLDSVLVKTGWNCNSYPSPDPSVNGCAAAQRYLRLDPQPSQVQLSIARQPGAGSSINLCTTDSVSILLNSAQSGNLVNPYVTFFPPAGLTVLSPVKVEYPRASGNYQNATLTSLPGGGYQINLSAHTGIGSNGILGTANANPSYIPLGADREAKVSIYYTTTCDYTSGTSLRFNAYGNRPCGSAAIDNGTFVSTSALDITGATVSGGAGVTIGFGGGVTSVGCGSTAVTLSLVTTPTTVGSVVGDTITYTLPLGMGYAGNLTPGYSAVVTGGGGAPTIVKVAMPTGVPASTSVNFNFDVSPQGGGCGSVNIIGAYQRRIASLSCGGVPCASSSVVISSATSPNITLVKPSLSISDVIITDTNKWVMGWAWINRVKAYYNNNNGGQAYTANTDSIEFFCGTSTTPFAVRPLTKSLAIGASDSDYYEIIVPNTTGCLVGDVVTAKIQTLMVSGTKQCLCSPSSYLMAGFPLPLSFTSTSINPQNCAVSIRWSYNLSGGDKLASFEIERSSNGAQYEKVSSLSANNTSYVDVTPSSGKWYYRIKAIGADGKVVYSNTLQATTSQCAGSSVTIYPNPASEQLNIVVQGSSVDNQYELVDALGRVVLKGKLNANANNKLDVSVIAHGVYMLKVQTEAGVQTQQVQIVR